MRRFVAIAALVVGVPVGAFAQTPPPKAAATTGETVLSVLRYDAKSAGTLLLIGEPTENDEPHTFAYWRKILAGKTPAQFAEVIDRRVLTVGSITALVPRTMIVLNTRPGKPDPFADLPTGDRLMLLLSQWTPAQWTKAGSDAGIGANDLPPEQRALFAGLLPAQPITLRTYTVEKSEKHGEVRELTDDSETIAPDALRLRLSRRVVMNTAAHDMGFMNSIDSPPGSRRVSPDGTTVQQELALPDNDDGYTVKRRDSAFGVRLIGQEPSRAKPGQLPLDTPRLRVAVPLTDGTRTVGDLLAQVAKSTRLELIADKRYAAYPVAVRGGRSVMAGDLLQAVCRSVNGTFRKMTDASGRSVYLLTDDVEGYGTRLKRISEWAREPERLRREGLQKAHKLPAASELRQYLPFDKTDPFAPTPEQIARIEAAYTDPDANAEYAASELSPAQRERAKQTLEMAAKDAREGNTTPVDHLLLGAETRFEWLAPDGRAFGVKIEGAGVGSHTGLSKAQMAMRAKNLAPAPNKQVTLAPLPAVPARRVAVLHLPPSDKETAETLAVLRRKGFTEAWFRVPFAPDAPERIRFAVSEGRKAGLSVGAGVEWLRKREANVGAPDEIGITGETADDWRKRYEPDHRYPGMDDHDHDVFYPKHTGWVRPQNNDALTMAAKIAGTPGLSALLIESPLAPGYAGITNYGDGLWDRVRLGYHPELRVACVRAEGFDPVDVGEQVLYADINVWMHPFAKEEYKLTKSLAAFRLRSATSNLADVWKALHAAAPKLPVYLPRQSAMGSHYDYFVRWDKPEIFPHLSDKQDDFSNTAAEAKAHAKPFGSEPLLIGNTPVTDARPAYQASLWEKSVQGAASWSGFAYDTLWRTESKVRTTLDLLPNAVKSTVPPARRPAQGSLR